MYLQHQPCCLRCTFTGGWIRSGVDQTFNRHSDMGCEYQMFTPCLTLRWLSNGHQWHNVLGIPRTCTTGVLWDMLEQRERQPRGHTKSSAMAPSIGSVNPALMEQNGSKAHNLNLIHSTSFSLSPGEKLWCRHPWKFLETLQFTCWLVVPL